jgi:ferredoxin, 2Fe-2S
MPRVTYVEFGGNERVCEIDAGTSVMRGALAHGVRGIDADCGGQCACATCHVYVDAAYLARLTPMSEMETSMLSFSSSAEPNSRLSCQIEMTPELDGLVVRLPESQH